MVTTDETMMRQEIGVIRALADGLHGFLLGLSDDDLNRQSACAAWTVRDVAGHLANRAERQIASMTRGRDGDASPPPGFTRPAGNMAMSAANADADIAYARALGDGLRAEFAARYAGLAALLDGFSGDEWGRPCWHPRRGTMTAREYVSQRIQELAVHDWDIRSAFDADAALHPDAVPALLGMSAHWLRAAYHPGADPPAGVVRFRFALSDADAVDVAVEPTGAQVGVNLHPGLVDLTIECDANTYLLLAYGRLNPAAAVAGGRLRTAGQDGLLERFVGWMVGF